MDDRTLSAICRQIYAQFPDVKGSRPKVKPQTADSSLLIFEGKGTAPDGKVISRTVRVVVSSNGKIAKITTSR